MIRSEQFHSQHPYRAYIGWALFYTAMLLSAVFLFLTFANSLHSYDAPVGGVKLKIPYSKYLVGETVTFSVTNNYNATINIVNNCPKEPLAVYRQVNDDWNRVHATSKVSSCSEKLRTITIEPGKTVSGSYKNWPALFKRPGKYRVAVFIEYFGSVAYQDLTIVKKPKATSTNSSNSNSKTVVLPSPSSGSSGTTSVQRDSDDDDEEEGTQQPSTQPPSSGTQSATIPVGSKGTVVLSYTSTQITVVSVSPSSGCWYEGKRPGYTGTFIEITFKCGGETQLQAWLSGGNLRTKIEND